MNDYLQVIKNGMSNIPAITEALTNEIKDNLGLLTQPQKDVIEYRLSKCIDCPFNSINAISMTGYKTELDYYHCSVCKCPINTKVKSFDSNCGLEWFMFNVNDESVKHIKEYYMKHNEPLELKWKAVNV